MSHLTWKNVIGKTSLLKQQFYGWGQGVVSVMIVGTADTLLPLTPNIGDDSLISERNFHIVYRPVCSVRKAQPSQLIILIITAKYSSNHTLLPSKVDDMGAGSQDVWSQV